jgi:hypothetical protein
MSAALREYLAKGFFLGLWVYLALIQPDREAFARVVMWGLGGLALGLLTGLAFQLKRGYRPGQNLLGFLLMVILDSSYFIYLGMIGGFALGTGLETDPPTDRAWLTYAILGGMLLGYGLHQLRQIQNWTYRLAMGFALGAALTYFAIYYLGQVPAFEGFQPQRQFAIYLLLGLPFFYLLTITGEAEESEVEIAALCAALGIGLYLLRIESQLPEQFDKLIFLIPVGLYFLYATRWLPGIRVFKHNLRGYGFLALGYVPNALLSFSRALQLDRKSTQAAEGLRRVMLTLDPTKIDAETAKLLPVEYCLRTVTETLINATPPAEKPREDAIRLLDILGQQRPDLAPRVAYLTAIGPLGPRQLKSKPSGRTFRELEPGHPAPHRTCQTPRRNRTGQTRPKAGSYRRGRSEVSKAARRPDRRGDEAIPLREPFGERIPGSCDSTSPRGIQLRLHRTTRPKPHRKR